jgi:predicted nucleotidyltransferase
MDTGTAPDLERVRGVLRRHLRGEHRAILFGSRAHGSARARSDWDIGIVGPRPLRGAVIQRIRDELEALPTLHSFDVVDLNTVPEGFRAAALANAVALT